MEKWLLEYKMVIQTYPTTYLWDSSDSSDSCDSCDSCDLSDSGDSSDDSDQKTFSPKNFVHKKNFFFSNFFIKNFFSLKKKSKTYRVMKLKNSICDDTKKLKLW